MSIESVMPCIRKEDMLRINDQHLHLQKLKNDNQKIKKRYERKQYMQQERYKIIFTQALLIITKMNQAKCSLK